MQTVNIKTTIQSRCVKCGGKLFVDRDAYGWYLSCICGKTIDIPDPNIKPQPLIKDLKD